MSMQTSSRRCVLGTFLTLCRGWLITVALWCPGPETHTHYTKHVLYNTHHTYKTASKLVLYTTASMHSLHKRVIIDSLWCLGPETHTLYKTCFIQHTSYKTASRHGLYLVMAHHSHALVSGTWNTHAHVVQIRLETFSIVEGGIIDVLNNPNKDRNNWRPSILTCR